MMDRFAAFETFVAVIETGSFSAAARRLKVGQPAVSKSIAQLESTLGVLLLMRSTRGLSPTESGQSFYEHARRALDEANEAEMVARGANANLRGTLRISAAVTFARLHIVPHLKEFLDMHPELSVDIILDDKNVDLLATGVELALRMGELDDSNMTAQRIARSPRMVIGTPAFFAQAGEPATPEELATYEAVTYTQRGGGTCWTFSRAGTEVPVVVSGRLSVSAAEGVRAAVLADMGLTVASIWMFAPELASGQVKQVLSDWTLEPTDLWALYPTGRMASARAKAFVAFVKATLAKTEP